MNKSYLIFCFFVCLFSYAQLSNKHWIPPLHARQANVVSDHYLYISTAETTPFQVNVTYGNGTPIPGSPFTVSQTNPVTVTIGNSQPSKMFLDLTDVNTVESDKGLILEGTKDFYVSFRMRSNNHAETLISKGRPGIGTSFRLGGLPQTSGGAPRNFVASVMATENGTTINLSDYDTSVVFASDSGNITADSQTFNLNAGQSIVFSGYADTSANLSGIIGALLTSNKPIAVNTGNALAGMTITEDGQDFTLDQIVSASQIGTQYIFIEGNGSEDVELPLIIANEDNTQVFVNGNPIAVTTLNAGEYYLVPNNNYQGINNKNIYVETSKPVFAYQIIGGAPSNATSGLNFIPPLSCFFQNSVYLPAINEIGSTFYNAELMVLTYSTSTLTVNGTPINTALAEPVLGNTDWVTYRISGYSGNVNVVSTGPLAVGVFGASGAAGYAGYYSGFGSAPQDTDVTVCSSTTKDLFDAIEGNPGTGGTWSVPAGSPPLSGNIYNPAINLPGEYIYTFTKDCNTSLTTISVKVNVTVQQADNVGTNTIKNTCVNQASFDLFPLLGTGVTTTGTWSPALASGTGIYNPAVDPSGTYTYTIPANGVCPALSSTVVVNNFPLPQLNTISTFELCDDSNDGNDTNGQVVFNLNSKTAEILGGQTGITVTYHISNSNAIANSSPITTYYGGTTTIYVRLTNNTTGCFSTTSFDVKVNAKPTVVNEVTLKQCDNDTDAISDFNLNEANLLISNQPNLTFTYFTSSSNAQNNISPISNANQYTSSNGTVWARVENQFGCFRVAKVNLIVSATQVPSTFVPYLIEECDDYINATDPDADGYAYFDLNTATNDPVDGILAIFPSSVNLIVTYYQSQADALAEQNAIDTTTDFRNTIPNQQTIWVRIDSNLNNDCVGLGPYVTLRVNPLPDFDLPQEVVLCVDPATGAGTSIINAEPNTPGTYTYVWNPANSNSNPAVFNASQNGIYSVTVTNTATGCVRQDQIEVKISSAPVAVSAQLINEAFSPGLSSIQAIALGGFGDYEYSIDGIFWQNSPVFNNLENGTYIVYARDKNGCGEVNSNAIQTISYPNYFTPNGDGYNDTWNIIGLTPEFEAKIYIFDRFGKLIKQINPYSSNGWDGTFNGNLMPSTDYWFRIEYKQNGENKEFKSHFSLKR
ncbi:Protein of unknown function precursor; putative adhesin [Flavobacterium indicum GPTSA100-9 = DSM 17447]|uniref:IgGFc-binding protein N-terminal domain-containing protein n=1 Tax=Flavobacterium indicum (strain DSM 17447 / CIP 109464 / GPTSA100-9) TaxID=1094466 RepID=H8XP19_FLAIG|nr:T9SS type B sorting domain-containing protein [Flavobacterium indicum]CCG52286.1 Protein of unknown function precursor; putative adhesin [Flavobacterium indicum GPTSA100-9 = DSM 17447]